VFPEQWVGRAGPTAWPARCPDLNPLDFYLWENLTPTVYVTDVSDVQDWQQRIRTGLEIVRTTPGIFQAVRKSLFSNANSRVEDQGGYFDASEGLCSYKIFFLYFGVGSFSVRVAPHYFILYNLQY